MYHDIRPNKRLSQTYTDGVALVTGGSMGLGLEIVRELLRQEMLEVVVLDVVEYPFEDPRVKFKKCDVGDEIVLKKTLESIIEMLESTDKYISVLVNNAGIRHHESLLDLADSKIHDLFNINTLSHIWILKAVINNNLLKMKREKEEEVNGEKDLSKDSNDSPTDLNDSPEDLTSNTHIKPLFIVSVTSVLGALAPKNLSVYSATKAAITLIHEALSYELSQYRHIRMLLVSPGQLTSGMFEDVAPSNRFFAPLVKHTELAEKIVSRIIPGHAGVLCEPLYANFIPAVRVMPMMFQHLCRWLSGMDKKINGEINETFEEIHNT